jgi:succinate dehydrogenase flavin-adding protein (antitoxin of CptAB toxin-antitoxin module)
MKELDVMLVRWLDGPGQGASSAETAHFDRLLDLPDPELAAYLLRGEPATDPELAVLVAAIRRLPADG